MVCFDFAFLFLSLFLFHILYSKLIPAAAANMDELTPSAPEAQQTTPRASSHRIPFVHRLSSFRRSRHSRTSSTSSQMSNHQAEINNVPADLVLKVDIIRGRNLNREDEVRPLRDDTKRLQSKLNPLSPKSQMFRIHMSMCDVEAFGSEQTPSANPQIQNGCAALNSTYPTTSWAIERDSERSRSTACLSLSLTRTGSRPSFWGR